MNLAILMGTVVSEVRKTDLRDGASVTKFRLKTIEQFRIDGETKERSQTHLIDVWNPYLQREVTPYIKEGNLVQLEGSIESRNVAKEGEPARWTTTIVLRNRGHINIIGGPGSNTSVHAEAIDEPLRVDHHARKPEPVMSAASDDGLGDEIPF